MLFSRLISALMADAFTRERASSAGTRICPDSRRTELISPRFYLHMPRFEVPCPHLDAMNLFRNHRLANFAVPISTNWLLSDPAEAKGKQGLYTRQLPHLLKGLRQIALARKASILPISSKASPTPMTDCAPSSSATPTPETVPKELPIQLMSNAPEFLILKPQCITV